MAMTNTSKDKEIDGRQDDWTEVYHTDSTLEAQRILDTVLRSEGIEGLIHDRTDHALPAPASQPGTVAIAVRQRDADRARQLLDQAAADGIMDDGPTVAAGPPI